MTKYQKKNLLIGGLLAIVVLMGIAYAAFASNLTITGTGSVSSNWCIGFDSTRTSDYQSVTSDTTITKGNIKYIIEMPQSTSLAVNATTTMKVTAMFQNDTEVTSSTNEQQTISVSINAVQDDGNGGFTPTPTSFTGDVYAWNTTEITVGTSTINDLASTKTAQPYYTSAADVMSASGYTFFNKYTVVNDTITEGYSCQTFGISGFEPVCLKMSTDGSGNGYDEEGNHTGNAGILKTLQSNSTFTGNNPAGSCDFTSNYSHCDAGNLGVNTYRSGNVMAIANSTLARCRVYNDGSALCTE